MNFHGPYTENILNINYRETDHPAAARAEHGDTIHEQIRETLHSQQPPYFFAMIYVNQQIQRPTFAYICPDSVLHPVRIRCHILQPDKATNYPNHATCVVPVNLCYTHPNQCLCTGMHTQLVDYEHILVLNTATTASGKLVSTLAEYSKATNEYQTAYRLRDTYADQVETYKEIRSRLYGPYIM